MTFPLVTDPNFYAVAIPAVLLLMDLLGMGAFRKDFDLKLLNFLHSIDLRSPLATPHRKDSAARKQIYTPFVEVGNA